MRNGRRRWRPVLSRTASKATVMRTYRCYLLNWSDNIVSRARRRACEDDTAMVMAVGLWREQHPTNAAMEGWEQKRCLGRSENDGSDARTLRTLLVAGNPDPR